MQNVWIMQHVIHLRFMCWLVCYLLEFMPILEDFSAVSLLVSSPGAGIYPWMLRRNKTVMLLNLKGTHTSLPMLQKLLALHRAFWYLSTRLMYCTPYLNFKLIIVFPRTNINFYFIFSVTILTIVSVYAIVMLTWKKKEINKNCHLLNGFSTELMVCLDD